MRRRALASTLVFASLGASACGGTTGQEGLPPGATGVGVADGGMDATVVVVVDGAVDDAGLDAGLFDVDITYADRPLPEAAPPPVPDAGSSVTDAGGPGILPCTTAGQTNCVQCQGNASGLCTPTEAAIVAFDIARNGITAGPDGSVAGDGTGTGANATSCYACLLQGPCIDDTQFNDVNFECEDPLATFGTAAQCEATLACMFATSCAKSAVAACYCGTAPVATTCQGNPAPGPPNGACDAVVAAGLGFPVKDGTDNTAKLENTAYASGKADQIFQCAITNHCKLCQP